MSIAIYPPFRCHPILPSPFFPKGNPRISALRIIREQIIFCRIESSLTEKSNILYLRVIFLITFQVIIN